MEEGKWGAAFFFTSPNAGRSIRWSEPEADRVGGQRVSIKGRGVGAGGGGEHDEDVARIMVRAMGFGVVKRGIIGRVTGN